MKLSLIAEGSDLVLYKGTSEWSGLNNWPEHRVGHRGVHIPGFLASFALARTYSEPDLTGSPDQSGMIVECAIDPNSVEDRTKQFIEWWDTVHEPKSSVKSVDKYDVSCGYPQEWRNGAIWTVGNSGSAHAGVSCFGNSSFVFCGISIPYKVIAFYNNEDEWHQGSN